MIDAAQEAEVDERTAIQACWDICSWRLLNRDAPLMLGGPGVVVQIDESLFRHNPKYIELTVYPSTIMFLSVPSRACTKEQSMGVWCV